jgi:hypothetical protein
MRDQLVGEAALADTRLAHEQEKPTPSRDGILQPRHQVGQFALAPDERCPARLRRPPRPDGRLEEPVLTKNGPLELAQLLSRLDAELLDQHAEGVLVGGERLRLATAAIEGEHQLRSHALALQMRARERLQLADDLGVAARGEILLDPPLEAVQSQLVEPDDHSLREAVIGEVGERRAAPESKRLAELALVRSSSKRPRSSSPDRTRSR